MASAGMVVAHCRRDAYRSGYCNPEVCMTLKIDRPAQALRRQGVLKGVSLKARPAT
jgi:hypothetical protein